MNKITLSFYQPNAKKAVHRWLTTLCLTAVLWLGAVGSSNVMAAPGNLATWALTTSGANAKTAASIATGLTANSMGNGGGVTVAVPSSSYTLITTTTAATTASDAITKANYVTFDLTVSAGYKLDIATTDALKVTLGPRGSNGINAMVYYSIDAGAPVAFSSTVYSASGQSTPAAQTFTPSAAITVSAGQKITFYVLYYNVNLKLGISNFIPVGTVSAACTAPTINTQPSNTSASYCKNATPTVLTVAATANAGGALSYQWYSSTDNVTNTSVDDIAVGTNSNSYTPSTVTVGSLYYYCKVTDANCTSPTNSAVSGKITVDATTVAGTAAPTAATICSGSGTTINLTGSTGTIQWQSSPAGASTWTNLGTAASFSTGNLTASTDYRAVVTSGSCGSVNSNITTVTVSQAPTTATAGADQAICFSAGSVTLAANTPTFGTGTWGIVSGPSTALGQFTSTSAYNAIFTPSAAGVYQLRWTISNAPCTASTDDVIIAVSATPSPAFAGGDESKEDGNSFTLAATNPTTGTGVWSIVSGPSMALGQFSSTSAFNATFIPNGGVGTYTLRWTVSNGADCSASTDDVILTVTVASNPAILLTSVINTDNQTVVRDNAITAIKYTYGGTATTASTTWTGSTPAGITDNALNTTNKTLTISGTPTTAGVYSYTVSTDGTPAASATGTITVKLPAPNATAATAITATGFTANWDAVTDADSYVVTVSPAITGSPFSVVTNSLVVTGLTANTTYTYTVQAVHVTALLNSAVSSPVTVKTLNTAKAITAFTISGQTGSSTIDGTAHTIAVVMPSGSTVTALAPVITISTGASVSPASGVQADFTSPVTYTVTAEDASTQDYTVTVTVTPTVTGTPASACKGYTAALGATASAGSTINWYANLSGGPSIGTGTSFTTPALNATTTYYVDATINGVTSAPRVAVVATVNDPTISGAYTVDFGSQTTLTGTPGSGTWQVVSNTSNAIVTNGTINATAATIPGLVTLTYTANGCVSAQKTLTVYSACSSYQAITFETAKWNDCTGASVADPISRTNPNIIVTGGAGTGTTNALTTATDNAVVVFTTTKNIKNIYLTGKIEGGATWNYSFDGGLTWSSNQAGGQASDKCYNFGSVAGAIAAIPDNTTDFRIRVSKASAGGLGLYGRNIIFELRETPPTLTGASTAVVCQGTAATISLTGMLASTTNNTITYNINGGAAQTASGVNTNASGNASFTITSPVNNSVVTITRVQGAVCTTSNLTVSTTLQVTAAPVADAGTAQALCGLGAVTLAANNVTGTWSVKTKPAGSSAAAAAFSDVTKYNATFTPDVAGAYTLTWTATATSPCTNATSDVAITVNTQPVAGTASVSSTSITSGTTVQLTLTGGSGSFVWNMSTNGGAYAPIAGATTTPYTTAALAVGNYTFKAVYTATPCTTVESTPTAQVTVAPSTVATIASFTVAGTAGTIDNAAGTITVTVPSGTSLSSVTPLVTMTESHATWSPNTAVDFSGCNTTKVFTATAEDGITTKVYNVTVVQGFGAPAQIVFDTKICFSGATNDAVLPVTTVGAYGTIQTVTSKYGDTTSGSLAVATTGSCSWIRFGSAVTSTTNNVKIHLNTPISDGGNVTVTWSAAGSSRVFGLYYLLNGTTWTEIAATTRTTASSTLYTDVFTIPSNLSGISDLYLGQKSGGSIFLYSVNVKTNATPTKTLAVTGSTVCLGEQSTVTLNTSQCGVQYYLDNGSGKVTGTDKWGTGNDIVWNVNTAGTYMVKTTAINGYVAVTMNATATVVVNNPAVITAQPATTGETINWGSTANALSVTATGTAPVTYQWYSNAIASNASGTLINGATANTYTPLTSTVGTLYYYCVVNNSCATVTSAVSGAIVVNKANQTITFNSLADKIWDDASFTLTATATSGLAVTFASTNTSVATVDSTTGVVTIVGPGTTTITASQVGNGNYNAAPDVLRDLTVFDSTTWTTGSAWTHGTPTAAKNTIIAGNFDTSTNPGLGFTAKNLTVKSGGSLTIKTTGIAGTTVTVEDEVINNAGANGIVVENNSSLLQVNDAAPANSGAISYIRNTTPVLSTDYTYWSSPVANQQLNISPSYASGVYYSYDDFAIPENWKEVAASTVMVAGKGYIVRGPLDNNPASVFVATLTGVPNNGPQSIAIGPTGVSVLIGNPYPSILDADLFLAANTTVLEGTIYFWTHNTPIAIGTPNPGSGVYAYSGDDYAAYNGVGGLATAAAPSSVFPYTGANATVPTGKIASGQGFFGTSLGGGTVVFNNTMRVAGNNNQFFKTKNSKTKTTTAVEKHRIWLNLSNTQGVFKQTLLGYVTDATNDYDSRFDGESFNANPFADFYSINQNKKLAIQGRALPFDENDEVPLGFKTTIDGSLIISIDHTDGLLVNQTVFLEDKLANTVTDLKNGNYTFNTVPGTFNNRFVLRYANNAKTLGTNEASLDENSIKIYRSNGLINVNAGNVIIATIKVYDIQGKLITEQKNVNATTAIIKELKDTKQVLVVKVTSKEGEVVTKKVIN